MSFQSDHGPLLTPSAVAHLLRCHPSAVIRWITRGTLLSSGARLKLQAFATPGGWRIQGAFLDVFLEAVTADRMQPSDEVVSKPPRQSARVAEMHTALAAAGF